MWILWNKSNRLRFENEFDKASGVFESIVSEYLEEAEAYLGLCLCKYGIEYVDYLATAKKMPTCHRTSYDSIFNDSNFETAQEYALSQERSIVKKQRRLTDYKSLSLISLRMNFFLKTFPVLFWFYFFFFFCRICGNNA